MGRLFLSPPDPRGTARELLLDAYDSGWIAPAGPHLGAFEEEVAAATGRTHAVALSSGTAALHLALRFLGVGPGDQVLTSTLTFVATVNAIRYLGAEPVLIDSEPGSWTMDVRLARETLADMSTAQRARVRAVVPVDLYGQCSDYAGLRALSDDFSIPVVLDAAESLGAEFEGEPAGASGEAAIVSFNGNKIVTCGGGGLVVTNNAALAERVRFWSTQARESAPHYEHVDIGYNYRLSNLLAAVGRGQMMTLSERVNLRRAHNVGYRSGLSDLPGVAFMPEAPGRRTTFWLTALTINPAEAGITREDVRLHLESQDIESRPVWKPMHLQPLYGDAQCAGGVVARTLFENGLCLPSGSVMGSADRDRVVAAIRNVFHRRR